MRRTPKTSLSGHAVSQLEASLGPAPVIELNNPFGHSGRLLLVDPREASITGTHKGWSYAGMILAALRRGDIDESILVREFTSGNAGIAAARVARLLGLPSEVIMPEGITPERETALSNEATSLLLTPEKDWLLGAMATAKEADAQEVNSFLINQSANEDNVRALTTVFRRTLKIIPHQIDAQVCTIGTGGSSIALGYAGQPGTLNIGVDPLRSPSTWSYKKRQPFQHQAHQYWGGGAGAASPIVCGHIGQVDAVARVSWESALDMAKWLGEQGLRVGLSTGGNVVAAFRFLKKYPGASILTVIHDGADLYRSMGL